MSGEQGIQIPAGTIVNGVPFVKYAELQKRIAELEEELKSLKPEPSVPEWIAPGKWVECDGKNRQIKQVTTEYVYYKNREYNSIEYVKNYAKPFTPPPMPELPEGFTIPLSFPILTYKGVTNTLDAWIPFAESAAWKKSIINQLKDLCDWREKWGTV
jgi:hypothetical protein